VPWRRRQFTEGIHNTMAEVPVMIPDFRGEARLDSNGE
jgi:hypothetical protein